ncbi:MAG: hypothetical protein II030_04820, partial [Treponema sp.]|nr:hypothetical protein [Treponema sp.]
MYSTQFWIFSAVSLVCLCTTASCFTATLIDRPSVQQRNVFMTSGIVIFFIIGHMLHFSGSTEEALLLGAKFEYVANICLLGGIYNFLAAFYRKSPNRHILFLARIIPAPFVVLIPIASTASPLWIFRLFFKSYSLGTTKNGLCELVIERGPAFYCYMVFAGLYALLIVATFIGKLHSSTKKERCLAIKMFLRLLPFLFVCMVFTFMNYRRPVTPLRPLVLTATTALCAYLVHKEKFR